MTSLETLTSAQQLALRQAVNDLSREFDGTLDGETVDRFVTSSFEQFAARAKVTTFLPLIAEKFARQRLRALARVEGLVHDGRPTVLFLCVHNAARSQIALGWFNHLSHGGAVAWSAGSDPGYEIDLVSMAVMAEVGIDITAEFPKPWTEEIVRGADVVVAMGCGDVCPIFPGKRYDEWDVEDPAGLPLDEARAIRDELRWQVEILLLSLGIEPLPGH